MENVKVEKYLPLTESTYYTLLTLTERRHGYAIMQKVEEISGGQVTIGPGTLYGALSTLEGEGLIIKVAEDRRRKTYHLTRKGLLVLKAQLNRFELMTRNGHELLAEADTK